MPAGWTLLVKSAVLHAVSLASTALTLASSRAAVSRVQRHRLQAELDRATTEIALLREELDIKDARWNRLPPRRRPFYTPVQRMRILQLKAARRWSCEQAARAFLVDEQTLRSWMRRVDEQGQRALIQTADPVNRFPNFVRYLVKQLRTLLPSMGKVRMAQVLARAGLHLSATTIARMSTETEPSFDDALAAVPEIDALTTRVVTAKYPGHTKHVDHFSRAVVGFAVFLGRPTSADVQRFLDRAIRATGSPPKYIISDKGRQFWCQSYKRWCRHRGIRPRFGAVGKYGSIAVVERFMRSLKSECTRRILVPLRLEAMRLELTFYIHWYNQHRPSMALDGRTPREVYDAVRPANAKPRFEPRSRWPRQSPCAAPRTRIKGAQGVRLHLIVGYLEDRKHLPVVELRRAA